MSIQTSTKLNSKLSIKVSLARRNLLEDIPRFLVAQAGIMFAVSLVTIQTGLQKGFTLSASKLIDQSRADIWVTAKNQVHLGLTTPLNLQQKKDAESVNGVKRAEGLIIQGAIWRTRDNSLSSVTLVGFDPNGSLFIPGTLQQGQLDTLTIPYTVFADLGSLPTLSLRKLGDGGLVGSLPAKLVGVTEGSQSLVLGNLLFTSLETATAYSQSPVTTKLPCEYAVEGLDCQAESGDYPLKPQPLTNENTINFILIESQPNQDLSDLRRRLESVLPNTRAYTREEMSQLTQSYWEKRSGIGYILGLGAVVGVVVGVVIVGQILYSSVSDHLKEFGTLKAMGASDWVLYRVILEQALWMGGLGYIPGMVLCAITASWTTATQGILILITPASAVTVLGITLLMCFTSAVFAIQKVTRVDPAIVFKE